MALRWQVTHRPSSLRLSPTSTAKGQPPAPRRKLELPVRRAQLYAASLLKWLFQSELFLRAGCLHGGPGMVCLSQPEAPSDRSELVWVVSSPDSRSPTHPLPGRRAINHFPSDTYRSPH